MLRQIEREINKSRILTCNVLQMSQRFFFCNGSSVYQHRTLLSCLLIYNLAMSLPNPVDHVTISCSLTSQNVMLAQ